MIISPEKMVFERPIDIVDYVSRGLPPTRKNFEKIMIKVRNPDNPDIDEGEPGKLYIPDHLFINCDNDTMNEALNRVYENRIRNRNITIGIIALIATGLIIGVSSKKNKEINDVNENHFIDLDMNLLD